MEKNSNVWSTKVAVVGIGYWGKNLVRNFHELGVLGALCDLNGCVEAAHAHRYADVKFYHDYGVLLTDASISAIVLATPASTHYEMSRAALLAGKHVFVEKPLAIDVRHGEELVRMAGEKNKILM